MTDNEIKYRTTDAGVVDEDLCLKCKRAAFNTKSYDDDESWEELGVDVGEMTGAADY